MNTLWNDRPDPVGIRFKSTPGHGYIVLSLARMKQVPEVLKTATRFYDGVSPYFEEDCEWARVALAFPHYFPQNEVEDARRTLETYHPSIFAAWIAQGSPTAPVE